MQVKIYFITDKRVLTPLLRWYKLIKLIRHNSSDTIEKAINKSVIMIRYEHSNH